MVEAFGAYFSPPILVFVEGKIFQYKFNAPWEFVKGGRKKIPRVRKKFFHPSTLIPAFCGKEFFDRLQYP
jgi:hypothetical protein